MNHCSLHSWAITMHSTSLSSNEIASMSGLSADNAVTFDLSNGCVALSTGITVAASLLKQNAYPYVLLVSADTPSKLVDYSNRF